MGAHNLGSPGGHVCGVRDRGDSEYKLAKAVMLPCREHFYGLIVMWPFGGR
jgi:hypothetical protein